MAAGSSSSLSPDKPKSEERKPAGMVMGPDGKPCKICTAFRNWNPTSYAKDNKASSTSRPQPPSGCPPDSEQVGRATWTFLHAAAAYYPDKPSTTQRANMIMLLRSLPVLYPCGWCAKDFGEDMEKHPPDVNSRVGLSRWLCERHNAVNAKLGKEKFDCAKVDERWKEGPADGRCG